MIKKITLFVLLLIPSFIFATDCMSFLTEKDANIAANQIALNMGCPKQSINAKTGRPGKTQTLYWDDVKKCINEDKWWFYVPYGTHLTEVKNFTVEKYSDDWKPTDLEEGQE